MTHLIEVDLAPGRGHVLIQEQVDDCRALASLRRSPHSTAIRVVVICIASDCGEKIADVCEYALQVDGDLRHPMMRDTDKPLGAVYTGTIPAAERAAARRRGDRSHQFTAFLDRPSAATLPDLLPAWCSHHGEIGVDRLDITAKAFAGRRQDRRLTVRVSPRL